MLNKRGNEFVFPVRLAEQLGACSGYVMSLAIIHLNLQIDARFLREQLPRLD